VRLESLRWWEAVREVYLPYVLDDSYPNMSGILAHDRHIYRTYMS